MNCENCNQSFQPNKNYGTIQKYCTLVCRNKAANNRRIIGIINKHNTSQNSGILTENNVGNRPDNKTIIREQGNGVKYSTNGNNETSAENNRREIGLYNENPYHHSNGYFNGENFIGNLEKYYESKAENRVAHYELEKAHEKIQKLQSELDEYYQEDDEIEKQEIAQKQAPQHEQIMRSFADMFREDPVNTANMVKTLVPSLIGGITDMFKSKTNEEKTN